mgnify:CR=1 FL=1|tara:strand:- start:21600 stop:21887 length:288 start_codon:yes stop_codon:yes gene_type:complete
MSIDQLAAENSPTVQETVTEIAAAAADLRGRISPEGLKSTMVWALLVMIPALLEEYAKMSPEQQAAFHAILVNKFSVLMSIPGAKLAYEAWRRDR